MMPNNNRESYFLLSVGVACLLLLAFCDSRACAQDVTETAPFTMQHPETKEPGSWIPRWLQVEHLHTENDLEVCTKDSAKLNQQIGAKNAELAHRQAALDESKQATETSQTALAHTKVELEDERESSDAKSDWLVVTSTVAVVTTGLAVLLAAL
jgi:hypothetical protein